MSIIENVVFWKSINSKNGFFWIDFITKQVEKKLGVDLNGDGVIGSGTILFQHTAR
jgi:hypothetical protein